MLCNVQSAPKIAPPGIFLPIFQKRLGILTQNLTLLFSILIYVCMPRKIMKDKGFQHDHLAIFVHLKIIALKTFLMSKKPAKLLLMTKQVT